MQNRFLSIILIMIWMVSHLGHAQNKAPNIIYILADDMGYGDVSAYNPEGKIMTPALDQLAAEGMKFTDAHTSSSVCTPTRYGILTGRYNWRSRLKSGVLTGKSKALIPNDRTTVASLLKKQGYQTAFIGKWHLGWDWAQIDPENDQGEGWNENDFDNIDFTKPIQNGPMDLGFDYSYGHSGSLDMAPYVYVENGKATAQPDRVTVDQGKYSWWRKGPTASDFEHVDVSPNFFRRSIEFVKQSAKSEQPFFLYLALPSPHTPILPPAEWKGKSNLNVYADFIMMIDNWIGKLMTELDTNGLAENTLLIFTTDNGCSPAAGFNEMVSAGHLPNYIYRGHKADIFEGGHRVPFIVKWPKKIKRGSSSDALICTTDLMATVADITGYELLDDEGEDSFSMLPVLTGEEQDSRISLVNHSINGSFAMRQGKWKLIMAPDSGGWSYPVPNKDKEEIAKLPDVQLYDLETDPGEENNLQDRYPDKVNQLKSHLTELILNGRSTKGANQSNDPTEKEWKQIRFISQ